MQHRHLLQRSKFTCAMPDTGQISASHEKSRVMLSHNRLGLSETPYCFQDKNSFERIDTGKMPLAMIIGMEKCCVLHAILLLAAAGIA